MTGKLLDRTQIKYIAIVAMLIDHIAMFFLTPSKHPEWVWLYALMRVIGRLTGPIMFFFLAEGYSYTTSKLKYGFRLLTFGLISQIPYALSHHNSIVVLNFNVILTLFVSFLMLTVSEKIENRGLNRLVVFALIMITYCFDWGVFGPFIVWLFYINRDDRDKQVKYYAIICFIRVASACLFLAKAGEHWYGELWKLGMFLVIPLLYLYNGEPGKKSFMNKWLFYIIYPAHLLIFWVVLYVI